MAILVEARDLTKHYPARRSIAEALAGKHPVVRAVDGIGFTIGVGESVGLLGESGCGKTTTGRLLLKLVKPSAGAILFEGEPLGALAGLRLRAFRQKAQLVFQNPFDAINPRFTIERALAEPLVNAGLPGVEHRERIETALARVRLPGLSQLRGRYPHQLSGGQLQRVVLARALVLEPSFLVADEPVSMLDVSVRAGVLNVMRDVRRELGLSALYISHDLALVRYVCSRTLVMYLGRIVEEGPTEALLREALHPYTRALVKAVPKPRVDQSREPLPISGNVPDAREPPSGCRFRDRCPLAAPICAEQDPLLREVGPGRRSACHFS
ncbi:MAG: ABC transporter ATP-binding protein [Microvirga sp.]